MATTQTVALINAFESRRMRTKHSSPAASATQLPEAERELATVRAELGRVESSIIWHAVRDCGGACTRG